MSHGYSSSFGQGQIPNPAAAKSRRALASSDEEVDELIFEESHRVGWPLLQPLPSAVTSCDSRQGYEEYITDWQEASSVISDILETQSVQIFFFDLVLQRTAGTSSTPVPMLRIEAHNGESGSWHNAVLRIVRSLQSFMVDNIQIYVELVERGYPRVLPAETEDAAVDSWEETLAPRVVDILARQSLLWQSLSLVRLSSMRSSDPFLTVLVEAANVRDSGWGNARPELLSVLNGTGCILAIWQMQVIKGLGGSDLYSANLDHTRFGEVMRIGDGIAPAEEENSTCTLGGFVQLRSKEGDTSHHILTNFHVIKTSRLQQNLEPAPLQSICLPRGSTAYPVKVPSHFDRNLMLKRFGNDIEDFGKSIHDSLGGGPSYIDRAEMGHAASKRHVESTKKEIARCEELRSEIVESSKRSAGAVRATSGYQHLGWENKKLALDWALVEVDPSRLLDESPESTIRSRTLVQKGFEIPAWASNPNQKWSRSPQFSQKVVKLGRMTGWTCGVLGPAKCFWRSLAKDDYQVGDWHDRYGTVVECLQVFSRFEEETPEDATKVPLVFAAGGDSGSVAKDFYTGAWVGLLFGAHRDGWALMTPMAAVMNSIESVTGEKVVDPVPMD